MENNIKKFILKNNIKNKEIAQKLAVDEIIVEAWENKYSIPNWEQSQSLSKILNVSIDALYRKELHTVHFTHLKNEYKETIYKIYYDFKNKKSPEKMKLIMLKNAINLGLKIKYQRNKIGLTQKQLGE